jgi:hypothetical protein
MMLARDARETTVFCTAVLVFLSARILLASTEGMP